mmetsp:Transcript_14487/g.16435  ORF Transcript_14487/g.16435 Transcript_14487/m.16435 type:complete len:136 (+) Transcript_14487:465-872(+)
MVRKVQVLLCLCALSTILLSILMFYNPPDAWAMFGIVETDIFVSRIYASTLLGEFTLQLGAAFQPEAYLKPTLAFMFPYKLASTVSMLYLWQHDVLQSRRRDCLIVAFCWFVPVVLLSIALIADRNQKSRKVKNK